MSTRFWNGFEKRASEIYHFESSDGCRHPDEIRLAHRYAAAKHQSPAQRAQLKAIVALEMARHSILSGDMEMKPYQTKVQKISDDYSLEHHSDVFEDTKAHEDFYSHLNRLSKTASMREVSKIAVVRDGKLLMGRRRDTGKWTEPGGHLDNGENPLMGAARELLEETGIKANPHDFDHLASKLVKKPDGSQILVHAYLLHSDVKLPTTMKGDPDEEVQRWHWVDIAHPRNEEKVLSNMHVPMKYNIVFRGLGLTEEP